MKPIAIFYHSLFFMGDPPELRVPAVTIAAEQMAFLRLSGLLDKASTMVVGINGGTESVPIADAVLPNMAFRLFHGLASRSENFTLVALEKWLPGHEDWNVLYMHAKGATKRVGDAHSAQWRNCMMRHLVGNWRKCVADLEAGYDSVGCHWLTPPTTPPGQYIWAGNFWWAKASFLATLPSIYERARIKESGIGALESRYEAEVWIGNGQRRPKVKDYHPQNPSVRGACQ